MYRRKNSTLWTMLLAVAAVAIGIWSIFKFKAIEDGLAAVAMSGGEG